MKLKLFKRRPDFGSFAFILTEFVGWDILESFQVVSPYLKGASSGVSSKEIMASVPICQLAEVIAR